MNLYTTIKSDMDDVLKNFFDTAKVRRLLGPVIADGLSKAGAYVRRSAKDSIRYTKRAISSPGQPPRAHGDFSLLREWILFSFDPATLSVVVGPVGGNMISFDPGDLSAQRGAVPGILEHGGQSAVIEEAVWNAKGKMRWIRRDLRKRGKVFIVAGLRQNDQHHRIYPPGWGGEYVVPFGKMRLRTYTVQPRPFMGPALDKNLDKIAGFFADTGAGSGAAAA